MIQADLMIGPALQEKEDEWREKLNQKIRGIKLIKKIKLYYWSEWTHEERLRAEWGNKGDWSELFSDDTERTNRT